MYYYLSCRVFSIGSGQIEHYYDDNNGEGYSIEDAEQRQKQIHTLRSSDGHLTGTEALIYNSDGQLIR